MTEMVWTEMNDRWPIRLPAHRAARPVNSWWEAQRLAVTHKRIFELAERVNGFTPRVLDVGAEEGDFPCLYAMWGAEVFLVEPNPKSWPWIKATFQANHRTPAGWYVGLLGSEEQRHGAGDVFAPGPMPFAWPNCANETDPTPEHGFHHLHEHGDVDPVGTIDQLVRAAAWIPDLICMDIEGGELHALRGAERVLREHRPEVIVSIHPDFLWDLYGQMPAAVHDLMKSHNYRAQFICTDHEEHWHYVPMEKPWPWSDPHDHTAVEI